MSTPKTTARPRRGRKFLCAAAVMLVALGAAEWALREHVPKNGLTPFCPTSIEGLPSELKPSYTTLYRGLQVEHNELGLRGPSPGPRRAGVRRIALVGDSVTYGNAVPWDATIGEQLQVALGARGVSAQVINAGVPGYNCENIAINLEAKVLPLEPDIVVCILFSNDADASLSFDHVDPNGVIDPMHGFLMNSALLEWVNVNVQDACEGLGFQLAGRDQGQATAEWAKGGGRERVAQSLARMRGACQEAGVELHVALYPFLARRASTPFGPIEDGMAREARALALPFVDLRPLFEEDSPRRYWANIFDRHPDGSANRMVAEALAEALL